MGLDCTTKWAPSKRRIGRRPDDDDVMTTFGPSRPIWWTVAQDDLDDKDENVHLCRRRRLVHNIHS